MFDTLGRYWLLAINSYGLVNIFVQDSTLFYTLSGKVFRDINWNGIYDSGDLPLPQVSVYDFYTGTTIFTDAFGNYSLVCPGIIGLPYSVFPDVPTPWIITSSPAGYTENLIFQGSGQSLDFGLNSTAPPNFPDARVYAAPSRLHLIL